jgi:hypothetical protein
MPDNSILSLTTMVMSGGTSGVIALLVLVITGLLWDRRRMFTDNAKKDMKLDTLMESHYKSNVAVNDALNSIKIVLAEISVRLIR